MYFLSVYIIEEFSSLKLSSVSVIVINREKLENEIDRTKKNLKYESRKRIESGSDVKAELAYIDLVRKIEKAGDCIYTIVQAI